MASQCQITSALSIMPLLNVSKRRVTESICTRLAGSGLARLTSHEASSSAERDDAAQ